MGVNTIKDIDVQAKRADVLFVKAFEDDIRKLVQILGIFDPIRRSPGTALKFYEASGTLASGTVAEGEDIPLSKYVRTGEHIVSLDWGKWAKETTLEAISANSYAEAVQETDAAFIRDIQKVIRGQIFDFLKTGTGVSADDGAAISGTGLQQTLANVWGTTQVAFENTAASPMFFMNPLDVAAYLGTATITNTGEVAFGMTYLQNFLGMYPTVLASDVAKGTVICTPRENLRLYYAHASSAEGFNFETSDATGYIGVHHEPTHRNMTFQTYAVSALKPFCAYLDKIWVATIE